MKFLIDAQLPARLAEFLNHAGHDAVHTLRLPERNRSTDRQIVERADADGRVVVTKDRDFRDGHLAARSSCGRSRAAAHDRWLALRGYDRACGSVARA